MIRIFLLLYFVSLNGLAMDLVTIDRKLISLTKKNGYWVESKCLNGVSCLSLKMIEMSKELKKEDGVDPARSYCQNRLNGRMISLRDKKNNHWGFCELGDKSLVDTSYLRSLVN